MDDSIAEDTNIECSTLSIDTELDLLSINQFVNGACNLSTNSTTSAFMETSWNCGKCTFSNRLKDLTCTICKNSVECNNTDDEKLTDNKLYEIVECQRCTKSFGGKNGMVINFCLHRFCVDCIKDAINNCVKFDLSCPYVNNNNHCDCIISKDQIKLLDCDILIDAYAAKEIELRANNFGVKRCFTMDCEGFESCNDLMTSFICKLCNKSNCLTCQAIHENKTCREYQQAVHKIKFICPNCTLENSALVYECEICHFKNPHYAPDDANYCKILTLTEQAIVENEYEFECPVCDMICEPSEGILLKACLHPICKLCLKQCIIYNDTPEVKCPYMDQNYSCTEQIADNEIRELLDEKTLNEYLNKSILLAEVRSKNSFHCKTPNCEWWCEYEVGVNDVLCPLCFKVNCFNCKVIHNPMTCKEYQDDLQNKIGVEISEKLLDELIAKGEAMRCPGCNITIGKREGCDFISCTMCHIGICWATKGPRWGPGGTGDRSGGCGCVFTSAKCHPNCGNCH